MPAAQPDLDVANFLAAASIGLTVGSNIFVGPVRPVSASGPSLGPASVFVLSTPGAAPLSFKGAGQGSLQMGMIQVRLRSTVADFPGVQALARTIRDTLHRATITGYVQCVARQSEPEYLGEEAAGFHQFSINFDLWRLGQP